ncbi:MAG: PQQ-binding-like beta-propeller repeat protein [bacterium]
MRALFSFFICLLMGLTVLTERGSAWAPQEGTRTDWPTHRGDLRRSGVSPSTLEVPRLAPQWSWASTHGPSPAWPGPARWDAYAGLAGLSSMRNYDPVFHPSVAAGRVYFGSSSEDAVFCLDAVSGQTLWRHPVGGPVRVTPHVQGGRVFFGSDDGSAYCVDAISGERVWRVAGQPDAARIWNNGRMISTHPVRTGVCVIGERAVFGASLLPWESSAIIAVDAETGSVDAPGCYRRTLGAGMTLEGTMAVAGDLLVVPQGRVAPLLLDHVRGESRGSLAGGGGSFCIIDPEGGVLHGPGNKDGWITDSKGTGGESVASYSKGTAMVVGEHVAYMLSPGQLGALDRPTQSILWTVETSCSDSLIMVGSWLVLGGMGRVEARDALSGALVWEAEVPGRVHGLACTESQLFVATDKGVLMAFAEDDAAPGRVRDDLARAIPSSLTEPPAFPADADPDLLDHYLFQEPTIEHRPLREGNPFTHPWVLNLGRPDGPAAHIRGPLELIQAGELHALELDGSTQEIPLSARADFDRLPRETISAEAWVRVDRATQWGGLIGAMQDNGEYERGWVLGFRQDRFGFAIKGTASAGPMTWLVAPQSMTLRGWHHVVGTYDGRVMRLYVDGEAVAETTAQSGAIQYPDQAFYQAGAYRDDDEFFRLDGALHELAVWTDALTADEILRRYKRKQALFPGPAPPPTQVAGPAPEDGPDLILAGGPVIDFPVKGRARLRVHLPSAAQLRWVLVSPRGEQVIVSSSEVARHHELTTHALLPQTLYTYHLESAGLRGPVLECDTHFDLGFPGLLGGAAREPWSKILREADPGRGIVVVLGASAEGPWLDGVRHTEAQVLVVAATKKRAHALREVLLEAGLHGQRVNVHCIPSGVTPDLPPCSVNTLLVDPSCLESARDWLQGGILESLRPSGGMAWLPLGLDASGLEVGASWSATTDVEGFRLLLRGELEGAGSWTHMYASPDNSAFGGEELAGAHGVDDLNLVWVGRPGPRYQTDRQNRKPSPLAVAGRLFLQGHQRIIALDGHNGQPLWNQERPELARFNIPRSSSNWCADEQSLFVAMGQRVERLGAEDGRLLKTYQVPRGVVGDWGFVASIDDHLIGTATPGGAQHTAWWGSSAWYDGHDGEPAKKIASHALFALRKSSGAPSWTYEGGRILDATLTIADGCIWFVEARHPDLDPASGRLDGADLWSDLALVCLDVFSGELLWQREAKPMAGTVAFYLAHTDGHLVLLSSSGGHSALYAFDADTGESRWRNKYAWEADHHGKHLSRPALVGGKVYARPGVFDLETGEILDMAFPEGHQCGSYAATSNTLILRAGDLCVWDTEEGGSSTWSRLRPDCWISTIPGNGMLLSPEGGGGCSCGSWIEASMGFLPQEAH